jgi:polygalacturonase
MLGIMRSSIIFGALAPFAVLACDNSANDACAAAFTASSATAAAFCATYTQSKNTATDDLPAFATACSMKYKKLSSACSCLGGSAAVATTAPSVGGVRLALVVG